MSVYTIDILKYANWFAPGATVFDHAYGIHDPQPIVLAGFLVRTKGANILIDTGMDDIESTYTAEMRSRFPNLGRSKNAGELLSAFGLTPDEINDVIITHLHFDHYVNAPLYRKARFHIPRIEWEYVRDPVNLPGCPECGFPRGPLDWLATLPSDRLILREDHDEPMPGISLRHTGGHSPGHMVVDVDTADGRAIVVGDAFYLYEHIERDIPLGYRTNLAEVLAGYRWLRAQNAILLPAHDQRVFERHPGGRIG